MDIRRYSAVLSALVLSLSLLPPLYPSLSMADEYGTEERGEREERRDEMKDERRERRTSGFPENALYSSECSSCHFLYHPGLLPERSWERLMENSDKHFGENLALDEKTKGEILVYLKEHSTERWKSEWSKKILKSAGDSTPERITEVPYIVRKHREIKKEVFSRASIKSFSNCGACHTAGDKGDFEEDRVKIPKQ